MRTQFKVNQLVILLFLLNIAFVGCKKISVSENPETISQAGSKIQEWLASQKINNTIVRVTWIDKINKNLLYKKLWI